MSASNEVAARTKDGLSCRRHREGFANRLSASEYSTAASPRPITEMKMMKVVLIACSN